MLAYFHGRIGEDDLLALLEQRALQSEGVGAGANDGPPADLQNYLIREFVEMLSGLKSMLEDCQTRRALEIALLGEFSPLALAERIRTAKRAGRRSPTAEAFQFVELLSLVESLQFSKAPDDERAELAKTRQKAIDRMLKLMRPSLASDASVEVLADDHFRSYTRLCLTNAVASRFLSRESTEAPDAPAT